MAATTAKPSRHTRRSRTHERNAAIDRALLEPSPEHMLALRRCVRAEGADKLAERVRQRATRLSKRARERRAQIVTARDALVLALYAGAVPSGWVCAFCDGSSVRANGSRRAGIGAVVTDRTGAVRQRISRPIGEASATAAEIAAVSAAIASARRHRRRRLWVWCDNRGLVKLWNEHRDDARLAELRRLSTRLERFALRAIAREHNQPANALARKAVHRADPQSGIRAILFDFGGVLAEEGFRNGLMALATEQGLDAATMPEQGMRAVYDSGFVLGRGTAADFWTLLRERTGLTGDDEQLSRRILDGFIVRPWMIALVRELRRRGYITGILSDQTHWLDTLIARERFGEVFHRIYNSFHLGKGKRDPSLFADVAADLALPPAAILLVDDDAGNVERARDAGWQAIQFTGREQFISELEGLLSRQAS